jgi:hypothetical protein
MGGVAFVLILALGARATSSIVAGPLTLALAGAGLLALWVGRRAASSVKTAWGGGCFANGLLSSAVAVGFGVQDELWSGRSPYPVDLDRAIGSLNHFVWELAARLGLIAFVLAAVLFAISYWLLGPPHRKA